MLFTGQSSTPVIHREVLSQHPGKGWVWEIQPTSSFLEDLSVNRSLHREQALTQETMRGRESWDKYRKRETVNRR